MLPYVPFTVMTLYDNGMVITVAINTQMRYLFSDLSCDLSLILAIDGLDTHTSVHLNYRMARGILSSQSRLRARNIYISVNIFLIVSLLN